MGIRIQPPRRRIIAEGQYDESNALIYLALRRGLDLRCRHLWFKFVRHGGKSLTESLIHSISEKGQKLMSSELVRVSAKCQERTSYSGDKFKPYDPGHDQPTSNVASALSGKTAAPRTSK